jgi:hypothetical protein
VTTVRSRPPVHALVSVPQASAELVDSTRLELVGPAETVQADGSALGSSKAQAAPPSRGKHARRDTREETSADAMADPTYDDEALPALATPPAGAGLPEQAAGRRGHRAPAEPTLEAEAMLALLAAESGRPLGGLVGRFDTTAARFGLIAGGIVAFSALLYLVLAIIGSML